MMRMKPDEYRDKFENRGAPKTSILDDDKINELETKLRGRVVDRIIRPDYGIGIAIQFVGNKYLTIKNTDCGQLELLFVDENVETKPSRKPKKKSG